MTERVGYIGLGLMGRPVALNLLRAGYPVAVYARRASAALPLVAAGAEAYASPQALAAACDIIFINVSDSPDVEAVVLGEQGVIHGASAGSVVVDMSTISPSVSRSIADKLSSKGIDMLDAPVSGGTVGAKAGSLSVMVGGKADIFKRLLPLFEVIGGNITHVGDHGAGQVAKACNQLIVAQMMAAIGEAFVLAEASDVDPCKVREALMGGFAGSRILEVHGQRMLDSNFEPGFKARLHQKDLRIVREAAAEMGLSLPGTEMVSEYIDALVGSGQGELDSAALVTVLAQCDRVRLHKT
jgi:2-hydroxy-3-oxopropionate reductase